jgi:anti-sigma regulatory factor (Ser/Thr protein kinase)
MRSFDPPVERGGGPLPAATAYDVEQTVDAGSLHALRATLAAHASRIGASDVTIEALVIVASELATNAIRHGGGSGRVRLWHDESALWCEVCDDGPGLPDPTIGRTLPDPDQNGGRGIWIARQLSVELSIEPGANGRGAVVTAALHRF